MDESNTKRVPTVALLFVALLIFAYLGFSIFRRKNPNWKFSDLKSKWKKSQPDTVIEKVVTEPVISESRVSEPVVVKAPVPVPEPVSIPIPEPISIPTPVPAPPTIKIPEPPPLQIHTPVTAEITPKPSEPKTPVLEHMARQLEIIRANSTKAMIRCTDAENKLRTVEAKYLETESNLRNTESALKTAEEKIQKLEKSVAALPVAEEKITALQKHNETLENLLREINGEVERVYLNDSGPTEMLAARPALAALVNQELKLTDDHPSFVPPEAKESKVFSLHIEKPTITEDSYTGSESIKKAA